MGGNIVTNSDLLSVLMSIGATLHFKSCEGSREVKFTSKGYDMRIGDKPLVHHEVEAVTISELIQCNEVLVAVFIPLSHKVTAYIFENRMVRHL